MRRKACILVMGVTVGAAQAGSIVDTKHNLSVTGPGTVKATTETEICVFCHTPHRGTKDAPLWNRYASGAVYIPYSSSTVKAAVGQPTGASKLCLSCHDGTVALGLVRSRSTTIQMQGTSVLPAGETRLSTDLADDHPISFYYDSSLVSADGQLRDPATLIGPVRLDKDGQVQCTACHNPHDNKYGKFLVVNNSAAALCTACHDRTYWAGCSHRTSTRTWNGTLPDPWPNSDRSGVADNGCENCHTPHTAGTKQRLLTQADEELTCNVCHNGNVAAKNVDAVFNKYSNHPVSATTGVHDPTENVLVPSGTGRHVTCVDCHNPHASNSGTASAPDASGKLAGVRGVLLNGTEVQPVTREYEICFRCHGDTAKGPAKVSRHIAEINTRLEFQSSNASYHPVAAIGKNPDMPSLISPWTAASRMYCTDCHNNNDTGGPRGPHGSDYDGLLIRQMSFSERVMPGWQSSQFALCFGCHSQSNIESNASFPFHYLHTRRRRINCLSCHDPHGVASQTHLINFRTPTVEASPTTGKLEFVDLGTRHGRCDLSCHGENHTGSINSKYQY
ncbi:MAG: hypothetical protein GXP31_13640 [Kiritimatiellaeota bacterium]|nr:hypothetical protein [Kiritimatiellota bacterium]